MQDHLFCKSTKPDQGALLVHDAAAGRPQVSYIKTARGLSGLNPSRPPREELWSIVWDIQRHLLNADL